MALYLLYFPRAPPLLYSFAKERILLSLNGVVSGPCFLVCLPVFFFVLVCFFLPDTCFEILVRSNFASALKCLSRSPFFSSFVILASYGARSRAACAYAFAKAASFSAVVLYFVICSSNAFFQIP